MKCHQCDRPAFYEVGDKHLPLCLDCYSRFSEIQNMQFLQNAVMSNLALDDMQAVTGIPIIGGRMPTSAIARAMQRGHVLNNIQITQSQIGVLNTGSIERIDAAITLSKGSDTDLIGSIIGEFVQKIVNSTDLEASKRNELIDLTETLSEEIVGRRKPATIKAVLNAMKEKVLGVADLVNAVDKLFEAINSVINF
jgi:hypothetical protein